MLFGSFLSLRKLPRIKIDKQKLAVGAKSLFINIPTVHKKNLVRFLCVYLNQGAKKHIKSKSTLE
jgi:hypothetical protein